MKKYYQYLLILMTFFGCNDLSEIVLPNELEKIQPIAINIQNLTDREVVLNWNWPVVSLKESTSFDLTLSDQWETKLLDTIYLDTLLEIKSLEPNRRYTLEVNTYLKDSTISASIDFETEQIDYLSTIETFINKYEVGTSSVFMNVNDNTYIINTHIIDRPNSYEELRLLDGLGNVQWVRRLGGQNTYQVTLV